MEPAEFRRHLEKVAGPLRYRNILHDLNSGRRWERRFLYWQEEILKKAGVEAATRTELFDQVEPMLRVCPMHEVELKHDPSATSKRRGAAITDYDEARAREFPSHDCGPVDPRDLGQGLWYCRHCRAAEIGGKRWPF